MLRPRLVVTVLLAAISACEPPSASAPPERPVTGLVAYLASSTSAPVVGATVIVTAHIATDGRPDAKGSFLAKLAYDPQTLAFVESESTPSGLLAVNGSRPGEVRIAGVSLQGTDSGVLFRIHFRVLRGDALRSLTLAFDELNDTDRRSRLRALTVARGVTSDHSEN